MLEKVAKTPEQALASLMNLCSRAEKSSGDAMRLMARWDVEQSKRAEVLQRLIADRFIDDSRYARAFVREKSRLNGWGAHKIKNGLRAKGIVPTTINEALEELSKEEMTSKLEIMLQRKHRTTKEPDCYKLKGKMLRYGLSLGYDYDAVVDVLDRIIKIKQDDDV